MYKSILTGNTIIRKEIRQHKNIHMRQHFSTYLIPIKKHFLLIDTRFFTVSIERMIHAGFVKEQIILCGSCSSFWAQKRRMVYNSCSMRLYAVILILNCFADYANCITSPLTSSISSTDNSGKNV